MEQLQTLEQPAIGLAMMLHDPWIIGCLIFTAIITIICAFGALYSRTESRWPKSTN